MKPITSFNGWLLNKIALYLKDKEGCAVEDTHYTADGARTTIQDSFGFRYEITIKTIGRIQHLSENAEENRIFNIKTAIKEEFYG